MRTKQEITTLEKIIKENLLWDNHLKIYKIVFEHAPLTGNEIAMKLFGNAEYAKWVRSRMYEMVNLGVVKKTEKVECPVTKRQIFQFDVTGSLPVKSEKRKTHAQLIRELEERLLCAEKVLLGVERTIPLVTKNGQPLQDQIQKYRLKYPSEIVRFKTRSEKGV